MKKKIMKRKEKKSKVNSGGKNIGKKQKEFKAEKKVQIVRNRKKEKRIKIPEKNLPEKKIGETFPMKKEGVFNLQKKDVLPEQKKKIVNEPGQKGETIEKYEIDCDGAKATVEIVRAGGSVSYNLNIPEVDIATSALMDEIRERLITVTTISAKEIVDPEAFSAVKERFRITAENLLREKLENISPELTKFLIGRLIQDMLGLGKIEFIINDPTLEEIVVPSSKEPIRVFSKKYGWIKTSLQIKREEDILNYSDIVARRVGRQITVLNPLLDAHLVTGDRVNAVLYPVNTKGNTITIRKFARNPYTIVDLVKNKTCSLEVAAILWLAIEYEMNVIISGGTGSGKTSFLNACMPFVPPNHRILSIEDTRELMLPEFLYWTPLVTRTPNPEGKGGISMLDLLVNSLRMRPDRIILGEMRKEEEARVLFEAMHTGHSVYATLHADSAAETISRLINPPLNVPANLLKAVNLNIVMFRDRRRGIRRVLQVAEFEAGSDTAHANLVYRWIPEEDRIVKHTESSRLFEDLSRHTGMSEGEINNDLKTRIEIIDTLIKNGITKLQAFGKVMNLYYIDKEKLLLKLRKKDFNSFTN